MANREMRSSLKRWISAVAWFFACVGAWAWAGFACVDGVGAVCGGPRVDVEVEPRSTFAFGRGFSRGVSVLFARVGPIGVCVRARVGVARRWRSALSHRFSLKAFSLI